MTKLLTIRRGSRAGSLRHGLAGLTAVLALLLAGTHAAPAQDMTIRLKLGDVSMNKLAFVMAYEEGIYKKNGLDVKPMFTQGSVDIIRRSGVEVPDEFILKGGTDTPMKIGGAAPTIVSLTTRAGSWDPLILGSTHTTSRWRIMSRDDINSPEELKGKRIGYSGYGAVTHMVATEFAQAMGWDPDFDWSMMSDGLAVEALQKGYVDAFVAPELHATMAVDAGFKVLVDLGDYHLPVAGSSILVNREWHKSHKDLVRRFMKAAVEAIALLKTDRQAAYRTLGKWYQITDPKLLEYFYNEASKLPRKPYPPVEGIRKVMEIYDSHEMRKYTLQHFYDDSYIRELDESGYIDSLYH